jgi:hypothetical protein
MHSKQQQQQQQQQGTMAFDHPIEADRIDDFSLFSAFVRAPLWILGGVLGIKNVHQHDEEDACLKPRSLNDDGDCSSSRTSPPRSPMHNASAYYPEDANMSPLQRTGAAWASISESNDSSSPTPPESVSSNPIISDNADNPIVSFKGLQRTKKTSWSDESGQRLCEYAEVSEHFNPFVFSCLNSHFLFRFWDGDDLFRQWLL